MKQFDITSKKGCPNRFMSILVVLALLSFIMVAVSYFFVYILYGILIIILWLIASFIAHMYLR